MIKRTLEISRDPAHLAVRLDQLLLIRNGTPTNAIPSIPCEDIGVVLVDHPETTYTHQALAKLMEFGAALVVCGRNHLPVGLLLPLSSHTEIVWRVNEQVAAGLPLKKRLWRRLVVAKIKAQAGNLPAQSPANRMLLALAQEVKSGDTTNVEGQAARIYWSAWLTPDGTPNLASSLTAGAGEVEANRAGQPNGNGSDDGKPVGGSDGPPVGGASGTTGFPGRGFRRDQDSLDPLNVMLNYGYAVLRAAVARALVSAGLFPALGIHHANRSNAFALADDLIEPLRPLVDARVRDLYRQGSGINQGLDQQTKAALLSLLTVMTRFEQSSGPLMVSLHRYAASLADCLRDGDDRLVIPLPTNGS